MRESYSSNKDLLILIFAKCFHVVNNSADIWPQGWALTTMPVNCHMSLKGKKNPQNTFWKYMQVYNKS